MRTDAAIRFEAKYLNLTGVVFTPEEDARTFTDWTDAIERDARETIGIEHSRSQCRVIAAARDVLRESTYPDYLDRLTAALAALDRLSGPV